MVLLDSVLLESVLDSVFFVLLALESFVLSLDSVALESVAFALLVLLLWAFGYALVFVFLDSTLIATLQNSAFAIIKLTNFLKLYPLDLK